MLRYDSGDSKGSVRGFELHQNPGRMCPSLYFLIENYKGSERSGHFCHIDSVLIIELLNIFNFILRLLLIWVSFKRYLLLGTIQSFSTSNQQCHIKSV